MNKLFLNVLHEGEALDATSLDSLKGGGCIGNCKCNAGGSNDKQNKSINLHEVFSEGIVKMPSD